MYVAHTNSNFLASKTGRIFKFWFLQNNLLLYILFDSEQKSSKTVFKFSTKLKQYEF